jgi:hypothetical protein
MVASSLGKIFFLKAGLQQGIGQLWASDGSTQGTQMLRQFPPSQVSSGLDGKFFPVLTADFQGNFYFIASNGTHASLWRTDGTAAGTVQVTPMGLKLPEGSRPHETQMMVFRDKLLFPADDGSTGNDQLWSYDGTSLQKFSTVDPQRMAVVNDRLYVQTWDRGIWVSDPSGQTISPFDPIPGHSLRSWVPLRNVKGSDNVLVFTDGQSLWRYDGTEAGTTRHELTGINAAKPDIRDMTAIDGALFFAANHSVFGRELWIAEPPTRLAGRTLNISGDSGRDSITLIANAKTIKAIINGTSRTFSTSTIHRINVNAFDGNDEIQIRGSVPNLVVNVDAGEGSDSIVVSGSGGRTGAGSGSLDPIAGVLKFNGAADDDSLTFDDRSRAASQRYFLGSGTFNTADGAAAVAYSGIEHVHLRSGSADDQIVVRADASVDFNIEAGLQRTQDLLWVEGAGAALTAGAADSATGQYTFDQARPITFGGIEQTQVMVAPSVVNAVFVQDAATPYLRFTFDSDVSGNLVAQSLVLLNLHTAERISVSAGVLDFQARTATFSIASSSMRDGHWRAVMQAGAVSNALGMPSTSARSIDFNFLRGDANHDGRVDSADRDIVAANWQQSGRTFSQGDFNYDGKVDVADMGILASRWQEDLSSPSEPAMEPTALIARIAKQVIS